MLATAGLLGVAVLMATMVMPSRDATPSTVLSPDTPAPAKAKDKGAKAKAKKPAKPKLTAKQLAARAAAVTTLRNQGYLPTREADFNPRHELRVLVAYRNGDAGGPRRAFFFVGTRMVGNDSTGGSSTLKLAKSGNRWATLAYGVYAPGGKEPINTTKVRFNWDGASLSPAGAIPLSRLATG
jgi:LppP/LprE lipoprotein